MPVQPESTVLEQSTKLAAVEDINLKSRIAVYIPQKNDAIDKNLAEYIDNYPDRKNFEIMFMREASGVYQLGNRRVCVKCVKENVEIRVGCGLHECQRVMSIQNMQNSNNHLVCQSNTPSTSPSKSEAWGED